MRTFGFTLLSMLHMLYTGMSFFMAIYKFTYEFHHGWGVF
jgi:hypothetical protein